MPLLLLLLLLEGSERVSEHELEDVDLASSWKSNGHNSRLQD